MVNTPELKRKLRSYSIRCVFLFVIFVAYLLLGGALFRLLEYRARQKHVMRGTDALNHERSLLIRDLWSQSIARSEDDWLEQANDRLDDYETRLKTYLRVGIDLQDDDGAEDDKDNPWDFVGSLFYCFTVLTTIGYGNLAPLTLSGKILTVVYGGCGIPLTLVLLSDLGKLLALLLKYLISRRNPIMDSNEDFSFTIATSLAVTFLYLSAGSLLFWTLEGWSLIDSSYFTFVTFSTIGLGDFVPSHLGSVLLAMVYMLSALSLVAMCFNVLQNHLDPLLWEKQEQIYDYYLRRKLRKERETQPPMQGSRGSSGSLRYRGAPQQETIESVSDEEEEEED